MPTVGPMLEPAVARANGHWDIWSLISYLLAGSMYLWISMRDGEIEAALVARIVDYPRMRTLDIPFVGGKNRQHWLTHESELVEWAKANGCKRMEGYVRKGWLRVLKDWKIQSTCIYKDL